MAHRHTEGILLKTYPWKEVDMLAVFYTSSMGKIRVVVRGVRRIHARLRPALEPFTLSVLELAGHLKSAYHTLTGASVEDPFTAIRHNMDSFGCASLIIDIVNEMCEDNEPHEEVFRLIKHTLLILSMADMNRPAKERITWSFVIRFLAGLGYGIQTRSCGRCGGELEGRTVAVNFERGIFMCHRCARSTSGAIIVPLESLCMWKELERGYYAASDKEGSYAGIHALVKKCVFDYLMYHTERPLKSKLFEDKITRHYMAISKGIPAQ